MIRLLICPHKLDYGGAQLGIHHWAKYLDKSKFDVSILAMGPGGLSDKFEAYYPVYYDAPGYPNILRYIDELKPDLIHACPPGGPDMEYIARAARRVPVTQTVMCPRPACNLADVTGTVVLSRFVLSLQPTGYNIVQIDLPFDVSEYELQYDRAYFALPEHKMLVGSMGNNRRENADFMRIARDYDNPTVHFVIRTDMRYRYWRGRKRITSIHRRLSEDEKLSLLHCLDIFMYPTSNEAYGNVFLEAMSQKLPIISYHDSSMPEVVDGGGILVPVGDIGQMKAQLDELIFDDTKRHKFGQCGFDLVRERNNPQTISRKYEEFFLACLARTRKADNGGSDGGG